MATRDLPHGVVAFRFATTLLAGDFDDAYDLLGPELKPEYTTVAVLKMHFDEMISRAKRPSEPPEVEVLDNAKLNSPKLDAAGWVYVAVWSEAITVTVKPFGQSYRITELIWGRP